MKKTFVAFVVAFPLFLSACGYEYVGMVRRYPDFRYWFTSSENYEGLFEHLLETGQKCAIGGRVSVVGHKNRRDKVAEIIYTGFDFEHDYNKAYHIMDRDYHYMVIDVIQTPKGSDVIVNTAFDSYTWRKMAEIVERWARGDNKCYHLDSMLAQEPCKKKGLCNGNISTEHNVYHNRLLYYY